MLTVVCNQDLGFRERREHVEFIRIEMDAYLGDHCVTPVRSNPVGDGSCWSIVQRICSCEGTDERRKPERRGMDEDL